VYSERTMRRVMLVVAVVIIIGMILSMVRFGF
jgi:hypothetical protein